MSSTPTSSTPPSPEQLAALTARLTNAFGQIVTILMRTPQYRYGFIGDLEWLVVPALASGQFTVGEAHDKATGLSAPVAVALWASVSAEVDQRLASSPSQPLRLKPEEWASGNITWLVEAAGDPRAAQALIKALVEQRFAQTGLKTFVRGPTGQPLVHVLRPEAFASAGDGGGVSVSAPSAGPTASG